MRLKNEGMDERIQSSAHSAVKLSRSEQLLKGTLSSHTAASAPETRNRMKYVHLNRIDLRDDTPQAVLSHPGMLSPQTRTLLYTLAADYYSGNGCIVDVGIFLGASTMALACGLQKHAPFVRPCQSSPLIESFERGIVSPNIERSARKANLPVLPVGESFEGILRQLIEPVRHEVNLHIGDIFDFDGRALGKVEICFLDYPKNQEVALHCLQTLFPRLIPGAYVIQHDYFFDGLPFIKYSIEALSDHFQYLGEVHSSAVFKLRTIINASDVLTNFHLLAGETKLQLHRQSEIRTRDPNRQYLMQLSRVRLLLELGELSSAETTWKEADEKYASLIRSHDGEYKPGIMWRISGLTKLLDRKRSRRVTHRKQAAKREARIQILSRKVASLQQQGVKRQSRIQTPSEERDSSLVFSRTRHGYQKLLRKLRGLKRHIEAYDLPSGGFVEFGCGAYDPIALAVLHYVNGFKPCYAIDLKKPKNETYSAYLMYEIITNILCFPQRYCFDGTNVNDLVKNIRLFNFDAFETGDFWGGFEAMTEDVIYETGDILQSSIEASSISRLASFAVLEHVDNIDSVCAKIGQIVRSGGICFHFVDLVDHRTYGRSPEYDSYTFLTEKDAPRGMNRLRANEIVEAHERHGFEVLRDERQSGLIPEETKQRLLPKFQRMRLEDVSVIKLNLVVRRI